MLSVKKNRKYPTTTKGRMEKEANIGVLIQFARLEEEVDKMSS